MVMNVTFRSGISLEELDKLSIIHVAGTKGKGSTCAFTENILRSHSVTTGLYTSPHLISVRERIRINGQPIDKDKFTKFFWKLHSRLEKEREFEEDMPTYFRFLTLLMFNVFLAEAIDVVIIEVGIGGEYDCTNIVKNPICVGITSLGLDHTSILGKTLEEIAFQKSGIFKKGALGFTVPQPPVAMKILESRARERQCSLKIVPEINNYPWLSKKVPSLGILNNVQLYNASIATSMACAWLNRHLKTKQFSFETTATALTRCRCPGRTQIFREFTKYPIDFYLDGAHTVESMYFCATWFKEITKNSTSKRVLLFNVTGDRDPLALLDILRPLNFHRVFFVPNIAGDSATIVDQINCTVTMEQNMLRCQKHCSIWGEGSTCANTVTHVLEEIKVKSNGNERINMLVTGSLHLVGALLAIIDPNLTISTM